MNTENIRRLFPAVYEQYLKENHDHEWSCKHDEYYRYCHGGGTVPIPACKYCTEYDGDRCMKRAVTGSGGALTVRRRTAGSGM